jgi:6-hydroxytryprostatin B O-methyltransferase
MQVGASSIELCEHLAKRHEDLSLQLHVPLRISAQINSQYTNIRSDNQARIAVQTYEGQVPRIDEDANVFILRHMLHHFPEAAAVGLLSAIASRLLPGGTIIIADLVLPAARTSSMYSEGMLRTRELIHKELSNGETRYVEDWENLVAKAGHGLHITKVTKPFGSDLSIIELQVARQNGH